MTAKKKIKCSPSPPPPPPPLPPLSLAPTNAQVDLRRVQKKQNVLSHFFLGGGVVAFCPLYKLRKVVGDFYCNNIQHPTFLTSAQLD